MQSSRQDTVPGAFVHLTFRTPLADYMRSAGNVEERDSKSVSSRANYPSVEATAATGQSSSDAELQAKMQKLEEENEQLRLAVQRSNAAVEQMGKDLQRLKDTAYKNSKNLRQNVINFTEGQEEEIKQLRGVGRFWMGMERLRHEKIIQFFDGNLPEDDIVFQLAEKGPPES